MSSLARQLMMLKHGSRTMEVALASDQKVLTRWVQATFGRAVNGVATMENVTFNGGDFVVSPVGENRLRTVVVRPVGAMTMMEWIWVPLSHVPEMRYGYDLPPEVPTFGSVEEADAWLEATLESAPAMPPGDTVTVTGLKIELEGA